MAPSAAPFFLEFEGASAVPFVATVDALCALCALGPVAGAATATAAGLGGPFAVSVRPSAVTMARTRRGKGVLPMSRASTAGGSSGRKRPSGLLATVFASAEICALCVNAACV
ncbi:MAG: hypothetical protein AAFV29_01180, partial [Myxococcota bacterium]